MARFNQKLYDAQVAAFNLRLEEEAAITRRQADLRGDDGFCTLDELAEAIGLESRYTHYTKKTTTKKLYEWFMADPFSRKYYLDLKSIFG